MNINMKGNKSRNLIMDMNKKKKNNNKNKNKNNIMKMRFEHIQNYNDVRCSLKN